MRIKHLFAQYARKNARKMPSILGLDIGSSAVKLLDFSMNNHLLRLESYAVEPLPEHSIVKRSIINHRRVGEAIQQAVIHSATTLNHAAIALANSSVVRKIITMPAALSEEEIESRILLEADQFIAFPLEDVALDFTVQGFNAENSDLIEVLLVVGRRDDVDAHVSAVEAGGLVCHTVDVVANALEKALGLISSQLPDAGFGKLIALLDAGATMTTLSVFHDMKLVYTREQVFGGRQLTEGIQAHFGLSFDEAELAKRQGGLPVSYRSEVLAPFNRELLTQVEQALQLFLASYSCNMIDQLVLIGGCSALSGIDVFIQQQTGIATCIANPFSAVAFASSLDTELLSVEASTLLLASGLALRELDYNG